MRFSPDCHRRTGPDGRRTAEGPVKGNLGPTVAAVTRLEARGFPACVRVRDLSLPRDAAGGAVRPVVAAGRANGLFSCRSGPAQDGLRRVVRIEIPGGFAAPSGLDHDARLRCRRYRQLNDADTKFSTANAQFSAGNWSDTNDLVEPHSVTDPTTKLLEKELEAPE